MTASEILRKYLAKLGCKKRGERYILDGISTDYYLYFDAEDVAEAPETWGTCDIYVAKVGSCPSDSKDRILILSNAGAIAVMNVLDALLVNVDTKID